MNQSVLVVGAGIAGIQASIDLAQMGFQVYLVERAPAIGGRMAQLDKTFPTNDCAICILAPKMIECAGHENVHLLTNSEVISVQGQAGDFQVRVRKNPRYVDVETCTACGDCVPVCPVEIPDPFNQALAKHRAIYKQFSQAVPAAYAINKKPSPCKSSCPAHISVQGYIALIGQGKYREALELIREGGVPFVGTLGRVCDHPCETICKRAEWDEPVAICALKRFAYDAAAAADDPQPVEPVWEETVGIVGAGPAGLTAAYELVRRGYRATVYDELPVAGGMLAVGIPDYRLPRKVLEQEIGYICELGVELKLNTPVGKKGGPSLKRLQETHDAVFVAIGAHGSRKLHVPGEELSGVLHAVPFLRELNLRKPVRVGKRVAVVGGGNAAIDAARSALRLGAETVQLVYRRSRVEMPAIPDEVAAAEHEGVELTFLANPVRVLEKKGHVAGLECVRMVLGEPDASGRRRPVPVEGSEFTLDVDTVIIAIGQQVISDGLKAMKTERDDRLATDPLTLACEMDGLFAGGDAVTGPASVVEAVAAGIEAAESIHRYLRGEDLQQGRTRAWVPPEEIQIETWEPILPATRARMEELSLEARAGGFKEVELGLTEAQARAEAERCLSCAVCSECLQCVAACGAKAIQHDEQAQLLALDVGAIVIATGFDPYDASHLKEYGFGVIPNVITGMQYERLVSASGPTAGELLRPSDGKHPHTVAFVQCVGSRDVNHNPFCSSVCCMFATKEAILANEHDARVQSTIFYTDLRAGGKRFQEYITRAQEEYQVTYIRGRPGRISENPENGNPIVHYEHTTARKLRQMEVGLVVLCQALVPRLDSPETAARVGIALDPYGFVQIPNRLIRPVDTSVPGIFACGYCQSPQDIPDSVAQASGVAARVAELVSKVPQPAKQAEES